MCVYENWLQTCNHRVRGLHRKFFFLHLSPKQPILARVVTEKYDFKLFYFVITACSIIKATLDLNEKSLLKMSKEFNDIEREINRPEMYEDERLSLEENILKQKVGAT